VLVDVPINVAVDVPMNVGVVVQANVLGEAIQEAVGNQSNYFGMTSGNY
jgi:hypothetical protein